MHDLVFTRHTICTHDRFILLILGYQLVCEQCLSYGICVNRHYDIDVLLKLILYTGVAISQNIDHESLYIYILIYMCV